MDIVFAICNAFLSLMKTFSISDALDVLTVSFLIYGFIKLIRETRAEQLVKGILILLVTYALSYQLNLKMLSSILNNFSQFGVLVLLVVFQPELRRALEHLGRSKFGDYWSLNSMLGDYSSYDQMYKNIIDIVTDTIVVFQATKVGALIVFERKTKLGEIIDTGTLIKARPSIELISNIFYNKAPLHDGAMIIKDGLIYAGGCILPLTRNEHLSNDLGTRHRAAIGISENSDSVSVIVSEETGGISLAINGILKRGYNRESLKSDLEKLLIQGNKDTHHKNIITSFRKVKKNEKT